MNRREAISAVTILLGGALVGGNLFLQGCKSPDQEATTEGESSKFAFTADNKALLDEIADTILPTTKTPGAKAAGVGPFIGTFVTDCYSDKEKKIFRDGLADIDKQSETLVHKKFMEATPAERQTVLTAIDKQAKDAMDKKTKDDPTHYFRMMKELTLLGYFTSEIGCTQAQRYIAVPGKYDGNEPYKPGDKSWAAA